MKPFQYEWRPGCRFSGDPQKTGEFLRSLGERITTEEVVEAAEPSKSPIHKHFEWDNDEAGRRWRLLQGRNLIRSVVVRFEDAPVTEPQFVHAISGSGDSAEPLYATIAEVLSDDELLESATREALNYMESGRDRWSHIGKVRSAFDRGIKELG
jgi:hypothetical protein